MRKLKILYLFNIFLIVFTFFYWKNYKYVSKYNNETFIEGVITEITVKDGNVKIILVGLEKVILNCYDCEVNLKVGDIAKFKGYFKEISEPTNFNLFNYKKYLMSLKIYKSFIFEDYSYIKSSNNLIYNAYNRLNDKISALKSSAFLKAMILGNTESFDNIYDIYKTNGIVHIFSVSGLHVGIIIYLLTFILKKIFKLANFAYVIMFPILIFYMLIINSTSIIRSTLMFIIPSFLKIFHLRISILSTIFYLIIFNILFNPYIIYNSGFLLSYSIAIFLIIASKKIASITNFFLKTLAISLVSFLASLPIMINMNYEFNLLTPLINIVIVPFVSIILFPLSLLVLLFPSLDILLYSLLNGFDTLNIFLSDNSLIISVGIINSYLIIIYYLLLIVILNKPKHIYLMFVYLIFLINIKNLNFNSYLIMIDVGQGDAIFVKNYFGENILIDAGSKESSARNIIIPYLKSIGINKIDEFIISHGDSDHIVGAIDILENFKVLNIYLNSYKNSKFEEKVLKYSNVHQINENTKLNDHIQIFNFYSSNENDDSLITYLSDYKVLLMGDASSEIEKKINISNINILKVGHHGSKTSTSKEFTKMVKPKLSLISVGLKNKYNHPAEEVLINLSDSLILMTSKCGMIKVNLVNLDYETYLCGNARGSVYID